MKLEALFEKEKIPSVKTLSVGEIAKKHGITRAAVEQQLKRGIKVELEHTKDKTMAREIARDHLSEIPDYYTRLIKMEKKAGIKD